MRGAEQMSDGQPVRDASQLALERAEEELRQARETFSIRQAHDRAWRRVRLLVSYISVLIIIVVMAVSIWVLLNHQSFPDTIQKAAIAAFFVDLLGTVTLVWKLI